MKEFIKTQVQSDKTVLVGLITPDTSELKSREYLDELEFLAQTAGLQAIKRFTQRLELPNSATFVGSGKLQEIHEYIQSHEIGVVIFDDELSPKQLRNVERVLGTRVIDRTGLILDIFATRAQTLHAKTQVEMALYQYMLPRLTRLWTHLERQRGGVGMRGPGETQLETDRRIILDKIARLKKQLQQIDKQKFQQRQNRGKMVRVALVGYTNVGKSTLMNLLSKSEVLAENKLFATLDTTVRKVIIHNLPFLLSDTVGFIRKLPPQLIESFKSTLDEVRESDLILHVVDVSHPEFEEHVEIVRQTLRDIGVMADKPLLMVFNKIDAYASEWEFATPATEGELLEADSNPYANERDPYGEDPNYRRSASPIELQRSWMSGGENDCVFVSAKSGEGIPAFKSLLYEKVKAIHIERYPYNDFLFQTYDDLSDEGQ